MKRIICCAAAIAAIGTVWGATIAVPDAATPVEKTAARELAEALVRITGAEHAVAAESVATNAAYFVGETAAAKRLAAANGWAAYEADEIRRGTLDGATVLAGDATRGVLYSVDAFLEDVAGVRWWTKDESFYPSLPGWQSPALKPFRYAPPFKFRETFYHDALFDADFKVHLKNNCTSFTRYIVPPMKEAFVPPEKGGNHKLVFFPVRRSAYHSFFMIIPPAEYFKDHPEWFSLVKGERVGARDNNDWSKCKGQLCLTNEEMFREFVKNTKRFLRENPGCDSIQVTQNDWNHGVCECEKCKAFYEREGAVSGLYIDFANRVAAEVEKEFPNVFIDTFAYQFTRQAPKTVKPRRNVLVRLCDIECAFNRPLAKSPADYRDNVSFMRDLAAWSKVAKGNLYIWDYQANFTSYMLPHPNLHVFADNIRTFLEYGAVGIFEQGDAMCPAGDFAALKQYVTAHLLWDPGRDEQKLVDEFLEGYYGKAAATHVRKALEIGERAVTRPGVPKMGCYHANIHPWIPDEDATAAMAEMDAALAAAEAEGGAYPRRVKIAKMSWDHAKLLNWRRWGAAGDVYDAAQDWKRRIADFGILSYRETTSRQTLVDYLKTFDFRGDAVTSFTVDGKPAEANGEGVLDLKAIYPGDVVRGKAGTRQAEVVFSVTSPKGGLTRCRYRLDWFGELFVNGAFVRKVAGPCTECGFVDLDLRPGRNEVKLLTRSGSGGNWYFSFDVAPCAVADEGKRACAGEVSGWWKGMLHSHTCWSDGSAFPEQAIDWYRSHGYHFYAMSDHNVFAADVDRWLTVSAKDGKYPPLNPMEINYRHGFPDARLVEAYRRDWKGEERLSRNGNWREIRLKTYAECARRFNEPGRFLLVPAVEASHAVSYSDGPSHQVHCNYMGVTDLLPLHREQNWGWTGYDVPLSDYIEMLRGQTEMKAQELGVPSIFTLNHPIWQWYDVPPEALVGAPKVRFFEVCNNGGGKPSPELPQDGFDTDRFWDVVNAFRARRGQPLLYGTGVDDVHAYGLWKGGPCGAGDAWIRVNSEELSLKSLFAAMEAGDFVACCGLEPERVAFDREKGRLEVSVAAKPDVPYVIRFIVSKRDFSEKPVKTFEIGGKKANGKKAGNTRVINVYDEKVGQVVKTVEGKPGEAVSAAYELAADDLYVRARIESPTEKPHACCSLHPKCRVAWTQPYQKR